jgi:hypothetical protein
MKQKRLKYHPTADCRIERGINKIEVVSQMKTVVSIDLRRRVATVAKNLTAVQNRHASWFVNEYAEYFDCFYLEQQQLFKANACHEWFEPFDDLRF